MCRSVIAYPSPGNFRFRAFGRARKGMWFVTSSTFSHLLQNLARSCKWMMIKNIVNWHAYPARRWCSRSIFLINLSPQWGFGHGYVLKSGSICQVINVVELELPAPWSCDDPHPLSKLKNILFSIWAEQVNTTHVLVFLQLLCSDRLARVWARDGEEKYFLRLY